MLGVGVLAWDYAQHAAALSNYSLFWLGMALCLAGTLVIGLRPALQGWEHVYALGALGAALWLPYFLRSPVRLIFPDELYHYQIAQLMLERGHTDVPVLQYPIPGEFPGIEMVALNVMSATGLSIDVVVRLVTLLIHILIPLLAYLIGRGLSHNKYFGFLAALIYISNTSYYFFHSIFSYETLGITMVLTVWALLTRNARAGVTRRDLLLIVPALIAAAATHHLSSYMLAFTVVVAWLSTRFLPKRRGDMLGVVALLSVLFPILWLKFRTVNAWTYLTQELASRIDGIKHVLNQSKSSRALFQGSPLPHLERLLDFAYPPLLALLAVLGLYLLFRRRGWRSAPRMFTALAIGGPVAWLVSTPGVLTPSSDAIFRAWPFLFVGLSMFCALGLFAAYNWLRSKARIASVALVSVVTALLLLGGISIGDNQAGRFALVHPQHAAGPEDITADAVTAAQWLEHTAGRYHLVVGDDASSTTFASFGFQRAPIWGAWVPFLATNPVLVSRYLRETQTEYVVVDQRDSQLLPRYPYYYGQAELYFLKSLGYSLSTPFPAGLIAKFDDVRSLTRIYDNGNIHIYKQS